MILDNRYSTGRSSLRGSHEDFDPLGAWMGLRAILISSVWPWSHSPNQDLPRVLQNHFFDDRRLRLEYADPMEKISFNASNLNFDALLLKSHLPTRVVLFAAGSGGNPERHIPLLNSLVERGCTVIAPYFERILSPWPSSDELHLRVESLQGALKVIGESNLPMVGIGHSIGATLLLALAGGQMWMQGGQRFPVMRDERLKKLVLFTPPTGFFQAPKALEQVQAAVQAWAGSVDTITPPQQIEVLREELSPEKHFEIHIVEGAGHFSFMNTLPPNIVDPMKDRETFLTDLGAEVCNFVMT